MELDFEASKLRSVGQVGSLHIGALDIAYWLVKKSDQAIVFVHGNSAGKEVFYEQFNALAETDYTLLSIDLPGHGSSSNSAEPADDYNFCAFSRLIGDMLDALGIRQPLMVGWSLGGHVVIEMAGSGIDLAGAMIFGTPPLGPGPGADVQKAFIESKAMAVTLNPNPSDEDLQCYIEGLYGTLENRPSVFDALAKRMDGAVRAHIGKHWYSGEEGHDQRTVVDTWAKPLAMLHGDKDVFASGSYLETLTFANLWRGSIQHVPHAGHAPFLESPDLFNQSLEDFAQDVFSSG
ncbi:MAG: alpha/beta hydrolase [Pseudomonadota bacterium]